MTKLPFTVSVSAWFTHICLCVCLSCRLLWRVLRPRGVGVQDIKANAACALSRSLACLFRFKGSLSVLHHLSSDGQTSHTRSSPVSPCRVSRTLRCRRRLIRLKEEPCHILFLLRRHFPSLGCHFLLPSSVDVLSFSMRDGNVFLQLSSLVIITEMRAASLTSNTTPAEMQ